MSRYIKWMDIDICTLGPATETPETLERLIVAGGDVVRLNFSHGSAEDHIARAKLVRDLAAKHGRFVAVLAESAMRNLSPFKSSSSTELELSIG
jgi:pyruvate kinase